MVSESTMTIATAFLSTPLSLLGWQFKPVAQAKAKKVQIPTFIPICRFDECIVGLDGGRALRGALHF